MAFKRKRDQLHSKTLMEKHKKENRDSIEIKEINPRMKREIDNSWKENKYSYLIINQTCQNS